VEPEDHEARHDSRRLNGLAPELRAKTLILAPGMSASALIIDDHPLYRDALTQLLGTMVGESNVKSASSAEEGLRSAAQLPDLRLVVLDFNLPGISGTEAIHVVLARFPEVDVVAVSASEDRLDATSALRAGAKLFISKAVDTDVMADAIRRTLAGDHSAERQWITPTAAGVLEADESSPLTPRQLEILSLLHLPNKEIGLRLGVAEVTVKMHVSSVFRVLGVANRTQAMQAARRLSLGERQAGS
jgi:DNA-binding NarL/FixJ family response regulator